MVLDGNSRVSDGSSFGCSTNVHWSRRLGVGPYMYLLYFFVNLFSSFDGRWKDCPDLVSPSKCFISRYEHKGSNQEIKVVSSNNLGDDATKSIYFNPDTESEFISFV